MQGEGSAWRDAKGVFDREFGRTLWRLTRIYWRSPDGRRGAVLLAVAIALELATVWGHVLLAESHGRIFDALQDLDAGAFFAAIGVFVAIVLGFVAASTFRIYVRQVLEIRWRDGLTAHFLERWIQPVAYCQEQLHPEAADNPDQRISEDVRNYVASSLGLSLSLLSAVVTLLSFGGLLWRLSGDWAIEVGATELHIPGVMLWVAIAYAIIATWLTHRVGRRLVPINFDRQRVEADFRFDLVRFREQAEAVALSRGEVVVRAKARERFGRIVANWSALIRAERNLNLLTTATGEANGLVPFLVAAPAYFAGSLTLGGIAQTRIAYAQVSGALAWVVNAYQEIARWRASIERLASFARVMTDTEAEVTCGGVRVERAPIQSLRIENLRLECPDGTALLDDVDATLHRGESIALLGPLGTGKSALIRAIAGLWPCGRGRIVLPEGDRVFIVPPRPFLPIGTLREAICFPSPPDDYSDEQIRAALEAVDLGGLAARLDDVENWEQLLSTGEEQRIGLARAFLQEPDWLIIDNATSGFDDEFEKQIYARLAERLPRTTVISLARRAQLRRYHRRHWTFAPGTAGGAATVAVA